jgi:hypothetical protein
MFRRAQFTGLGLGLALVAFAMALLEQEQRPSQTKLLAERIATSRQALDVIERRRNDGVVSKPETVYRWSRRLMEAERALADKKDSQISALEAHLQRMQEMEDRAKAQHLSGQLSLLDYLEAQANRQEAQAWLIELEAK